MIRGLSIFALPVMAFSISAPLSGEEIIPRYPSLSHYAPEWADSAFHREVVPPGPVDRIEVDFARHLVLEGLVEDEVDGAIAFLRDRKDGATFMVTKQKQEAVPFRLLTAHQTHNPATTTITITNGSKSAQIGFDTSRLTAKIEPVRAAKPEKPEPFSRVNRREVRKDADGNPVPLTVPLETQNGVSEPDATPPSGPGVDQASPEDGLKNER